LWRQLIVPEKLNRDKKSRKEGEMNTRERMILNTIEQIRRSGGDFVKISAEQTQKRLVWYEANKDRLNLDGAFPRQAYTMVLLKCMGINPREVPVVYEDERKIIWHSFNFCPYLEACKRFNLDTRIVCREAYEKPVQVLISRLHTNLKFSRNYLKIRPYEDYCEEIIELID